MESVSVDERISASDSVSAAFVTGLIKSAGSCGLAPDGAFAELGFDRQSLADPLGRIPYARLLALLEQIGHLARFRRESGIEIGRRLMPGSFSALGYAAASCKTLGEAIETISDYENVALTAGKTELVIDGEQALLYWSIAHNTHSYLLEEIILSVWVQLARSITDMWSLPIRVLFTGPTPENITPFTAFFGEDITFCRSKACIIFPAFLLKSAITHSDPFINHLMREQATHINQALTIDAPFTVRVTEQLRGRLAGGDFGQEHIASELCLSVRTLRRRLKEEGTSYQTLLDSIRRELARDYLADKSLSVYEVAMLLGYSEHSAFSAAFKRWFGLSPQEFRVQNIEVRRANDRVG